MSGKKGVLPYLASILSCVLWGTVFVANRYALEAVTPAELACLRFAVAAAILFPLLKIRKQTVGFRKKDTKYFVGIAVIGYYLSIELIMIATKSAGASLTSFLDSLNPIIITLLAVIILKEKMTPARTVCLLVSVLGMIIISGGIEGGGSALGVAAAIASLFTWSTAAILTRKIAAEYDAIHITVTGMLLSLLLHIPTAVLSMAQNGIPSLTPMVLFCLLYSGSVGTAVPHFMWNYGLQYLPASTCTLFYPLMPLTSAILAVPVLGEKLTARFFIGGALIAAALIISGFAQVREKPH